MTTAQQKMTAYVRKLTTTQLIAAEAQAGALLKAGGYNRPLSLSRIALSSELHHRGYRYCYTHIAWVTDHDDETCPGA